MSEFKLRLGKKAKALIKSFKKAKVIVAEGTTQASKTTNVSIGVVPYVMQSKERFHLIAGSEKGNVEKNYITDPNVGIEALYKNAIYYKNGHGKISNAHIEVAMPNGEPSKIIYIVGGDDSAAFKWVRKGVYGLCVLDEANLFNEDFVSEVMIRGKELKIITLNPDTPDNFIYQKYANHCRPLPEWEHCYPEELLRELNLEPYEGWIHWYFTFEDNISLSKERIEEIKRSEKPGTSKYLSLILGLRQIPDGLCYPSFSKKNIMSKEEILDYLKINNDRFIQFSAGLDTSHSGSTGDKIAGMFIGITEKRRLFILAEDVYNNKDLKERGERLFAPSDICYRYNNFLLKCCKEWKGNLYEAYIDCADEGTKNEWDKLDTILEDGLDFYLIPSFKSRMKVNARISCMDGWMQDGDYIVCDDCVNHIAECNKYIWDKKEIAKGKKKPVDKDNHTIDSVAYAVIPYCTGVYHLIGNGPAEIRPYNQ